MVLAQHMCVGAVLQLRARMRRQLEQQRAARPAAADQLPETSALRSNFVKAMADQGDAAHARQRKYRLLQSKEGNERLRSLHAQMGLNLELMERSRKT